MVKLSENGNSINEAHVPKLILMSTNKGQSAIIVPLKSFAAPLSANDSQPRHMSGCIFDM